MVQNELHTIQAENIYILSSSKCSIKKYVGGGILKFENFERLKNRYSSKLLGIPD